MRRILYIYYIPHLGGSRGVYNKLISQLNSANSLNIKFLLLTCDNVKIENKNLFVERIITSQVIDWIVDDKRMKPFYNLFNYQHTGFMVFIRKIM